MNLSYYMQDTAVCILHQKVYGSSELKTPVEHVNQRLNVSGKIWTLLTCNTSNLPPFMPKSRNIEDNSCTDTTAVALASAIEIRDCASIGLNDISFPLFNHHLLRLIIYYIHAYFK